MTHDDPSDQLGQLMDALIESPDETTEVWGPAECWPPSPEIDGFHWTTEEDLLLLRKLDTTPWQRWLAEPGELE